MPIDPAVAIGADLGETRFSWASSDVLLYHLALGAGAAPRDPRELRYVLEDEDIADGIILACQSVPVTDAVEVSYE